jgi:hypothetical protein
VFLVEFDAPAFCLNSPDRADNEDYPESLELGRQSAIGGPITVCGE